MGNQLIGRVKNCFGCEPKINITVNLMTSGSGGLGRSRESVCAPQLSRESRTGCDSPKHPDRKIRSTHCVRSGPVRPAVYGENGVGYREQTWLPLSLALQLRGWNIRHAAVGGIHRWW